jgi:hypothetical protein
LVNPRENEDNAIQTIPPKSRKKKIGFYIIIASIIVLTVLIASSIALPALMSPRDHGRQILRNGDYLLYDVSGSVNSTAITPVAYNFTMLVSQENSVGYEMHLVHKSPWPEDPVFAPHLGHFFRPYWDELGYSGKWIDNESMGHWIGNESISTSFGTKFVKVFSIVDGTYNETIMCYVGFDSYIVHRWIVTSSSGAYQYTYELVATNNELVDSVDNV